MIYYVTGAWPRELADGRPWGEASLSTVRTNAVDTNPPTRHGECRAPLKYNCDSSEGGRVDRSSPPAREVALGFEFLIPRAAPEGLRLFTFQGHLVRTFPRVAEFQLLHRARTC